MKRLHPEDFEVINFSDGWHTGEQMDFAIAVVAGLLGGTAGSAWLRTDGWLFPLSFALIFMALFFPILKLARGRLTLYKKYNADPVKLRSVIDQILREENISFTKKYFWIVLPPSGIIIHVKAARNTKYSPYHAKVRIGPNFHADVKLARTLQDKFDEGFKPYLR